MKTSCRIKVRVDNRRKGKSSRLIQRETKTITPEKETTTMLSKKTQGSNGCNKSLEMVKGGSSQLVMIQEWE